MSMKKIAMKTMMKSDANTNPSPVVDLSLVKTVDNESPKVGDQVTFTLTINNAGPSTATGVEVVDQLPDGYNYISDTGNGTYDATSGIWTVGSLEKDENQSLEIVVEVLASGNYNNQATISNVNEEDSNEANDETDADANTNPSPVVDLSLVKTVDNESPKVGEQVTFTLTINNAGPSTATGVEITDQLPDGYNYISDTGNGTYDATSGIWTVGSLEKDESQSLEIVVEVLASGNYNNQATISNVNEEDSNEDNDEADADANTDPSPVVDLSLEKTVDNTAPKVGDQVTFTLKINNAGPSTATGVEVVDQLPDGYEYISDKGNGTYDAISGIWTVGDLEKDGSATLQITVEVLATGNYNNEATISNVNEEDSNEANDEINADASTDPSPVIDLELDISVSNVTPKIGDQVTIVADLTNRGPSTATEISIMDKLPTGIFYISHNDQEYNPNSGIWGIDSLEQEESTTLEINAIILLEGDYLNTGEVVSVNEFDIDSAPDNGVDTDGDQDVSDDPDDEDDGDGIEVLPLICEMTTVVSNIICSNNETPSDKTDDQFYFDLRVSSVNGSIGWFANTGQTGTTDIWYTFGPYPINEGPVQLTITDALFGYCISEIEVLPPLPCSNECDLIATYSNVICEDNNTPSDASDDLFSFEISLTGANVSESWVDNSGFIGNYNEVYEYGPYNISDGEVNIAFNDVNKTDCIASLTILPPATCSDDCEISADVFNISCNNNNTPSDASDDTFTFNLLVEGFNLGGNWSSDIGLSGKYNEVETFGPFEITQGDFEFTIIDEASESCTNVVRVIAPSTCSNECDLNTIVSNINCDDNGTPSDASDDLFYFDLLVEGFNVGANWSSDNGLSGAYNETRTYGPYSIADGIIEFTIIDGGDENCTELVSINPPGTCSNECDLNTTVSNINCDDNGTPSDASDDLFYFDLLVEGFNVGANWSSDNGLSGAYNETRTYGPYSIADGIIEFRIIDGVDENCTELVSINPPGTCSNECDLNTTVSNINCDDNGTPSDASDDLFYFDLLVEGFNVGANWSSDNGLSGAYNETRTYGPYSIADGIIEFTIIDGGDENCTELVSINPPGTCSNECDLNTTVSNINCDDNGTPSDASDDLFYFDLLVEGFNVGANWSSDNGLSGAYNETRTYGPYSIADGIIEFRIIDGGDENCTELVSINPPATCSNECDLNTIVSNINCDDNGTPSDASDDLFYFDLLVEGFNVGANWSSDNGLSGAYNETRTYGPYSIADGIIEFRIIDGVDENCTELVSINPPNSCSNDCFIDVQELSRTCLDNNTPSDPSDDSFEIELLITGTNNSNSFRLENGITGNYNTPIVLGPYLINEGPRNILITDNEISTCSLAYTIQAGNPCSEECSIGVTLVETRCDDNDTPSIPEDDTFSFVVMVDGENTSGNWTSDFGDSGEYGREAEIGPFDIVDGDFDMTFRDSENALCASNLSLVAPETCSNECFITFSELNKTCLDNGTPDDPSDDLFVFDLLINGPSGRSGWNEVDGGIEGDYNESFSFGPFSIQSGIVVLEFVDRDDPDCKIFAAVYPPETCSEQCTLNHLITNLACDNNGTPSDPNDDTFTFNITVFGNNTGSTWRSNLGPAIEYGVPTKFGPYDIAEGAQVMSIIDGVDRFCQLEVTILPPEACSNDCSIKVMESNKVCSDNGTPDDPTDDTYTLQMVVEGTNLSDGWESSDGRSGNYFELLSYGPYFIREGDVQIEFRDALDPDCTILKTITPPASCSFDCAILPKEITKTCFDNGTPSNPEDDVYTVEIKVDGFNMGDTWQADGGVSGDYGETVSFGPYSVNEGVRTIRFNDGSDSQCSAVIEIVPSDDCSKECALTYVLESSLCDDNNTPDNPTDDVVYFDILVSGNNTGTGWLSDNIEGAYDQVKRIGPFSVFDPAFDFVIRDLNDATCRTNIFIDPTSVCPEVCFIEEMVVGIPVCDNNGTPSIPGDDTFTFSLKVNGINTATNWTSNVGISGNYEEEVLFGPFKVVDGPVNVEIRDQLNNSCRKSITITPPRACSDECMVDVQLVGEECNNNGTPADFSDDTFIVYTIVTGDNLGGSWTSDRGIGGEYGKIVKIGPFNLLDGDIELNISDKDFPECSNSVLVKAPEACFIQCNVTATVSNITCQDNGTPSDPDDDVFTADLLVTGNDTGVKWTSNLGIEGVYNELVQIGPFPISVGSIELSIRDIDDANCGASVIINPPARCSDNCSVEPVIVLLNCNDNNTLTDPSDDTFSFIATISGDKGGSGWIASDGTEGQYDNPVIFGPYLIADGVIEMTFSDNTNPLCKKTEFIIPPSSCSNSCIISSKVTNVICNDNGTPSDKLDDTFTFDLKVRSRNTSMEWISNRGHSGKYDETVEMGPYRILDGDIELNISDRENPDCTSSIKVSPPEHCSFVCEVIPRLIDIDCNNNGTLDITEDDTYSFDIYVEALNTESGEWETGNGGLTGKYGEVVRFGPVKIINGDTTINFVDKENGKCIQDITISAPESCSSYCGLIASGSNRRCQNNGTPNYPDDDVFTFDVLVQGWNVGEEWVSDKGVNGVYKEKAKFGPFKISEGQVPVSFEDKTNPSCNTSILINPPRRSCSFEKCSISPEIVEVTCNQFGSPNDPSDDVYTVTILVNGNSENNPESGWICSENRRTGIYGKPTEFGPYSISRGPFTLYFYDNIDSECIDTLTINPPEPCSLGDACEIVAIPQNIVCDNNNTPSDPSDDQFYFDLIVSGNYTSDGWVALNSAKSEGVYDEQVTFGPYPIAGGNIQFTISDKDYDGCTAEVNIVPPTTCSDECSIDASIDQIFCENNNTPDDTSDDSFMFTINVTANGLEGNWIAAIDGQLFGGQYGVPKEIGPFESEIGSFSFEIMDSEQLSCSSWVQIIPPNDCSENCDMGIFIEEPYCGNSDTPFDQTDDTFSFDLKVIGGDDDGQWVANDPNVTIGNFNEKVAFGPYLISDGTQSFSVSKAGDNDCLLPVQVDPPFNCSGGCAIRAFVQNIVCYNNGTPFDPLDDFFTLELLANGINTSVGWATILGDDFAYGFYDQPIEIGPFNIRDGNFALELVDLTDEACSVTVDIIAPEPCSEQATIEVLCPLEDGNNSLVVYETDDGSCTAAITIPLPTINTICEDWTIYTEITNADGENIASIEPYASRTIENIEVGRYEVHFTVNSVCGNTTTSSCSFMVVDREVPIPLVNKVFEASIGPDGVTVIAPEDLDLGSTDNCGIQQIQLRRRINLNEQCEPISPYYSVWGDAITFTCCDIGDEVEVEFLAVDGNFNESVIAFKVRVVDNLSPVLSGAEDEIINCANLPESYDPTDFGQNSQLFGMPTWEDNCSYDVEILELNPEVSMVDDCNGTLIRKFIAVDEFGNQSDPLYQEITITEDPSASPRQLNGFIRTFFEKPVEGVQIELTGNTFQNGMTDKEGKFEFDMLEGNRDYLVAPTLDSDHRNGITTLDIIIIHRHILGIKTLDSPYLLIAADVNDSKSVTTLDLIELRRMVLGHIYEFGNNTSWRFVSDEYEFEDASRPWLESYPQQTELRMNKKKEIANFIGIKVGDVNGSATSSSTPGAAPRNATGLYEIELPDQILIPGNNYRIPIQFKDLHKIQGFQLALELDRTKVEATIIPSSLFEPHYVSRKWWERGIFLVSWDKFSAPLTRPIDFTDGTVLFELILEPKEQISLKEVLFLNENFMQNEVYWEDLRIYLPSLEYLSNDKANGVFNLYQNNPNPFAEYTSISFDLPSSSNASLTIHDITGRVIKSISGNFSKGTNEILLNASKLPKGIVYYTLETDGFVATKKMLVLDK